MKKLKMFFAVAFLLSIYSFKTPSQPFKVSADMNDITEDEEEFFGPNPGDG